MTGHEPRWDQVELMGGVVLKARISMKSLRYFAWLYLEDFPAHEAISIFLKHLIKYYHYGLKPVQDYESFNVTNFWFNIGVRFNDRKFVMSSHFNSKFKIIKYF